MKKSKAIFVAVILLLAAVFAAACGDTDDNTVSAALSYYSTTTFPAGQSATDNYWTQAIESELGFKMQYKYALTNTQYTTKIDADIASGKTPDMYMVDVSQIPTLIRANMIHDDLSEVFDTHASPLTKQIMGWNGSVENSPNFQICSDGGKLKGLPWVESSTDTGYSLLLRKDWLDDLGLDVPKTIANLEHVLIKFNSEKGAKGLGLTEDIIYSNAGSAGPLFNAFGAYPQIWVEKPDGSIEYGFFQEEMTDALSLLRNWYSRGLIYQQFAVSDLETVGSRVASGEIGAWIGVMSLPLHKMNSLVANDTTGKADWISVPVPGRDGDTPAKVTRSSSIFRFHVVKKGYKYPERLVQLINLFVDKMWGENAEFTKFNSIANAFPFQVYPATKNLDAYKNVTAAIDADRGTDWWNSLGTGKDIPAYTGQQPAPAYYGLNSENQYYYAMIRDYLANGKDGDARNWGYTRIFYKYADPNGAEMAAGGIGFDCTQSVIEYYEDNGLYVMEKFRRYDTPSLSRNRDTIETTISILIKNIITAAPGYTVDKYMVEVELLKSGAAKDVLKEVNEAYRAMSGN